MGEWFTRLKLSTKRKHQKVYIDAGTGKVHTVKEYGIVVKGY
jgi:hypothetical protein